MNCTTESYFHDNGQPCTQGQHGEENVTERAVFRSITFPLLKWFSPPLA